MFQSSIFRLTWMLLGLSILTATSCVRERDYDISMAQDLALQEFIFQDVVSLVDDAASKKTGELLSNYKTRGYCATITHDTLSTPRTLIIDFGNTPCMCNDGHTRRGQVKVSYLGSYKQAGCVRDIRFDSFYVDRHLVLGKVQVIHEGLNGASQPFFTRKSETKLVEQGQEDTLYYQAEHIMTLIQGSTTPIWGDDVYQIAGNGSGRNVLKSYFAMTISEPLIKPVLDCRYFIQGKIELQPQGKALRIIDYGDGHCDWDASVTLNDKVFYLNLK